MPTSTYDLIASNVLSTSASSVTFSSIPATYRDLVVVGSVQGTGAAYIICRFNSDSGSNYNYVSMIGDGSGAYSYSASNQTSMGIGSSWGFDTSNFRPFRLQVMDYSATDKHKTSLGRLDNSSAVTEAIAYRWASTSAVTSISLATNLNQFASGSTFYLYGIVS